MGAWLVAAGDRVRAATAAAGTAPLEAEALVQVHNDPGRSVDWLRARLDLSHSGTVRLVERLAGAGLLHRGVATADARAAALTLTEVGQQRVAALFAARERAVGQLLAEVPEAAQIGLWEMADAQLRTTARDRIAADVTCRLCEVDVCVPVCPVEASITGDVTGDVTGDDAPERGTARGGS